MKNLPPILTDSNSIIVTQIEDPRYSLEAIANWTDMEASAVSAADTFIPNKWYVGLIRWKPAGASLPSTDSLKTSLNKLSIGMGKVYGITYDLRIVREGDHYILAFAYPSTATNTDTIDKFLQKLYDLFAYYMPINITKVLDPPPEVYQLTSAAAPVSAPTKMDDHNVFLLTTTDSKYLKTSHVERPGFTTDALIKASPTLTQVSLSDDFTGNIWYVGLVRLRSTCPENGGLMGDFELTSICRTMTAEFSGLMNEIKLYHEGKVGNLDLWAVGFAYYSPPSTAEGLTLGKIGKFCERLAKLVQDQFYIRGYITTVDFTQDPPVVYRTSVTTNPVTSGQIPTQPLPQPQEQKQLQTWFEDIMKDPNKMVIAIALILIILILLLRR